jgi:hypothetical protein
MVFFGEIDMFLQLAEETNLEPKEPVSTLKAIISRM